MTHACGCPPQNALPWPRAAAASADASAALRASPVVDDVSGKPWLFLPRQACPARRRCSRLVPLAPRARRLLYRGSGVVAFFVLGCGHGHVAGSEPPLFDHVRLAAVHRVYLLGHRLKTVARQLRPAVGRRASKARIAVEVIFYARSGTAATAYNRDLSASLRTASIPNMDPSRFSTTLRHHLLLKKREA